MAPDTNYPDRDPRDTTITQLRQQLAAAEARIVVLHGGNVMLQGECERLNAERDRAVKDAREDGARLDALEDKVNEDGGLILHNGDFAGNYSGLGLRCTGRTLRQAIDGYAGFDAAIAAGGEEKTNV